MNTGIEEIDSLQAKFSLNSMEYVLRTENGEILLDEDGNYIINESFMQEPMISDTEDNDTIQQDSTDILDFSSKDPFSETGVY
jgi:hypothetical protein